MKVSCEAEGKTKVKTTYDKYTHETHNKEIIANSEIMQLIRVMFSRSRLMSMRSAPHNDSWHAILYSFKNINKLTLSGKHNSMNIIFKQTCSSNIVSIIPGHYHREMSILIRKRRAVQSLTAPQITHAAQLPDPAFRTPPLPLSPCCCSETHWPLVGWKSNTGELQFPQFRGHCLGLFEVILTGEKAQL